MKAEGMCVKKWSGTRFVHVRLGWKEHIKEPTQDGTLMSFQHLATLYLPAKKPNMSLCPGQSIIIQPVLRGLPLVSCPSLGLRPPLNVLRCLRAEKRRAPCYL